MNNFKKPKTFWSKAKSTMKNSAQEGLKKLELKTNSKILLSGKNPNQKEEVLSSIVKQLNQKTYSINLSDFLSKYIGETEKNIDQLFDKAQKQSLILFFDEADALFGKRTEVKDSHDRYANQEVSYLLKRIEAYEGVVLVATKHSVKGDINFKRFKRL